MKFCISFGKFELKYFFYSFFFIIILIYMIIFVYYNEVKITHEHLIFYLFFFFLGYLLNIIPTWISHIKSKEKEKLTTNKLEKENVLPFEYIYNKPYEKYLSKKDILKFFFVSLILLLASLIEYYQYIIDNIGEDKDKTKNYKDKIKEFDDNKKEYYDDGFIIIEIIIFFLVSKFDKEVYYKHQNISFLFLILVEIFKNIYFLTKKPYGNIIGIIQIILKFIFSILNAIYYLYIKGLIKYKFISPAKCNFMIGLFNVPLIILIYFIISFTPLGNIKSKYYFDNIFELFKNLEKIDAKNVIFLTSLPFAFGFLVFIINNIINDYTIYHIYIPFLIRFFIENIIKDFIIYDKIILISSFIIELIMIFVFLEIIEINCCGLNKNLKRNIESRGRIDSSLTIENDDDDEDEIDDERNDENNKIINSNY